MRITNLSINGFGMFQNVAIGELPPGLTLFEGRNEAGKSTLTAFIRAVLFGFENRKAAHNRYEPLRGGRHGGALTLAADDGIAYRIERVESGAHGRVTVTDLDGRRYEAEMVKRLLHGTSKILYQNVFAFGLTELQRLETLQATEVSHHLYTAGLGTGSVPFSTVMSALDDEQGQLFKPGARKRAINLLVSRLDETHRRIRERQALPDEYYVVREHIQTVEAQIRQVQDQMAQAQQRVVWLQTLVRARSDWEQLVAVRRELEELPNIGSFPAGGVERLEQIDRRLQDLDTRLEELAGTMRVLQEQRAMLHPDSLVLEHQEAIRALADDREHFRKLLEQLPALRARTDSRRKTLDDVLLRLGSQWDDHRLAGFDASISLRERIRGFRDRLAAASHAAAEAAKRRDEAERVRKAKAAEVDRLQVHSDTIVPSTDAPRPSWEERDRALRHWIQHQHHARLLRQRQHDLQQTRGSIAEHARHRRAEYAHLEAQKGVPLWVVIAMALLFGLLGGAALYVGQVILAGALVVAGILFEGLLIWWRDRGQDARQNRLDELQRQHQGIVLRGRHVQRELEELKREIETVAEKMRALSELAIARLIESPEEAEQVRGALDAERRLYDQRSSLEARIQEEEEHLITLLNERESSEEAARTTEHAYEESKEAWESTLKMLDLGEGLTPDGALEVLATVEGAKVQLREWQESALALTTTEAEVESIASRINEVLHACGRATVSAPDSPAALLTLRQSLEESNQARLEVQRFTAQLSEKQREFDATDIERERVVEQRRLLLDAGGAEDSEDFRHRAVISRTRADLEQQIRQLEIALDVHAGSLERRRSLEETFAQRSRSELERELTDAETGEREPLADALARKLQEKGRLEQQLQSLEGNDRLSDALLEYQTLLAQLEQQVQRWAVKAITRHLLDKARQVYERERQPAVLKQASAFFQAMTSGRYRRVIVPIGETRLEVELKNGRTQSTDRLSRGTAEQLYLAMRLALVREYAKHAGVLPLVVDDVLVNFDPDRARAAIDVLLDIATTHQILFFTCHPHVIAWFLERIPDLVVRPLPQVA